MKNEDKSFSRTGDTLQNVSHAFHFSFSLDCRTSGQRKSERQRNREREMRVREEKLEKKQSQRIERRRGHRLKAQKFREYK